MSKTSMSLTVLLFLGLLSPCVVFAQKPGGSGRSGGGVIDVQIRNENGTPGPRDIHVRLESAEGGAEADAETVDGGKCQFRLATGGVFMVRISGQGYQEVSERVEIIGTSRGFVTLTLKPLPGIGLKEPEIENLAPPAIVSATELNIPEVARKEYEKGENALHANDAGQAAKHFERAAKLFPNYPLAYRMLGEAYLQSQDYKKSEEALLKTIALDPSLVDVYVDLGAVYNQQKNYPQAEAALKKGLGLSPEATAAKYELAKTYFATNRWQEAEPLVRDVVNETPGVAGAHVLFANILLKRHDAAGALREYKEYLELEPAGSMATQVRDQVEKLQKALGQ